MNLLSNRRVAIVTGALGGIGMQVCNSLSQEGYLVIGVDRDKRVNSGLKGLYVNFDIRKLAQEERYSADFLEVVREKTDNQPVCLLINNAADQILGNVFELSAESWRLSLETNVIAPAKLISIFHDDLKQCSGLVVNISSIHSKMTKPNFAAYSVSKAALSALTRSAALDAGSDYRVLGIAPAAVNTKMLKQGLNFDADLLNRLKLMHPTRRISEPHEIAQLIVFLASTNAPLISGTDIQIDGAISARLHDPN